MTTLIMCFMTLYADPAVEVCYLVNKPAKLSVVEYCAYRDSSDPSHEVTVCHVFNENSAHDTDLLK